MKVTVLFFASCRELAGTKCLVLELDGAESHTSVLRQRLADDIPALAPVASTITLAVNHEYIGAGEDIALKVWSPHGAIPAASI
eukprot:21534-Heterococcus_DN1.PRE.5